jgi:hypothetical protein
LARLVARWLPGHTITSLFGAIERFQVPSLARETRCASRSAPFHRENRVRQQTHFTCALKSMASAEAVRKNISLSFFQKSCI